MSHILRLLLLLVTASVSAQQMAIVTPPGLPGGTGQAGALFDLVNVSAGPITLVSIDQVFFDPGVTNVPIEVWMIGGGIAGNETNGAAWTLVGSALFVGPSSGPGTADAVPICFNGDPLLTVASSATVGLYITSTDGTVLSYTTPNASVGDPVANDGNVETRTGFGGTYPFGSQFSPRDWNGVLHYEIGGSPTTSILAQVNRPVASLNVNGNDTGTWCQVARTVMCVGEIGFLNLDSTLPAGTGFDLALQVGPAALPGIVSPGGQAFNVNLAAGYPIWASQGGVLSVVLPPVPPLPWLGFPASFPFPAVFPSEVHGQAYWFDPGSTEFVSLSAPVEVLVTSQASQPLTLGDDDTVSISTMSLCSVDVSYYDTIWSEFFVNSNGSVSFGTGATSFAATVTAFTTEMPRVAGMWSDLSPNMGGTITVAGTPTGAIVSFTGIPQFPAAESSSFMIELTDSGTTILGGYAPDPGFSADTIVGFSPGLGALNPGSLAGGITAWQGLGVQMGNPLDAVYEHSQGSAPAVGWNAFVLNGNGTAWEVQ